MFASASRFRLTVLFVVLASSLVLAHSDAHNVKRLKNARRHAAVNAREYNNTYTYEKRFENTRFTFFPVGQNACGSFDHDSDFIVAINTHQWDGGSHCYEKITIDYQGKSTGAMITDECEECPYGAIDLSPSLFSYLAGSTDPGQIYGSWNFGGGAAPTVTTMPDKPKTTSTTHQQPTSTPSPTPTPTPSPTTHKTTSHKTSSSTPTSTSTSTSSVAPSTTSSSVEPTTTVVSFDTGTLDSFNLAMLQLAGLQNAIFANPNIGASYAMRGYGDGMSWSHLAAFGTLNFRRSLSVVSSAIRITCFYAAVILFYGGRSWIPKRCSLPVICEFGCLCTTQCGGVVDFRRWLLFVWVLLSSRYGYALTALIALLCQEVY